MHKKGENHSDPIYTNPIKNLPNYLYLIFADSWASPRKQSIRETQIFAGHSRFRRKPQETAESRRNPQKTADWCLSS